MWRQIDPDLLAFKIKLQSLLIFVKGVRQCFFDLFHKFGPSFGFLNFNCRIIWHHYNELIDLLRNLIIAIGIKIIVIIMVILIILIITYQYFFGVGVWRSLSTTFES